MTVAILTDSGVDLNPEVLNAMNIHLIKGWVQLGVSLYKDIDTEDMFEKMKQGERFSTTQPDTNEFRKIYKQLLQNHTHVLVINVSSQLDQMYDMACEVAREFPGLVTVLDSQCVSISQGLQVIRASEMAAQGRSVTEIVTTLENLRPQMLHLFALKSLQYMRINKRISGTQAFLGKALGMNPVLQVKDGKTSTLEQPRGFDVALSRMKKRALDYGQQHPQARLAFAYAPGSEAELEAMRNELLGTGLFQDMGAHAFGRSVAANTGPGALGICLQPA